MNDDGCGCSTGTSCGCRSGAPEVRLPGDPTAYTHHAILERMLDLIARAEVDDARPLQSWTTRSLDDPGIALLSAQAGAGHVLAWNLHRQHADATLTESEDPDAILLLTRLLGHHRRPALAATTVASFALEELDSAPAVVTVPAGTKVSTIAEPNEKPQVFETDAEIEARREWNAIAPLRGPEPQSVTTSTTSLVVDGVGHPIRPGDHVLVFASQTGAQVTWLLARVTEVTDDAPEPTTTVSIAGGRTLTADASVAAPASAGTVVILGDRAMPFGATAPDITFMPEAVRVAHGQPKSGSPPPLPTEWKDFRVFSSANNLHLDTVHAAAAPGRVAAFVPGTGTPRLARITSAVETARSAFGVSARTTLTGVSGLDDAAKTSLNPLVRELAILVETARVTLVVPLADPALPLTAAGVGQHPGVQADNQADRLYLGGNHPLLPGRPVVLAGADPTTGAPVTETAVVQSATAVSGAGVPAATLLRLEAPLVRRFRSSTLAVLGNCVDASQGESAPPVRAVPGAEPGAEILGSGDPTVPLPRYPLARKPLAHVPAPGPTGYAPAIEVRVDGRAYTRADSLPGDDPTSRAYRVLAGARDGAEVQFAGRLPTGSGNVTAVYRTGGGVAGNLAPGLLVQMLTPVLGVRSVTNPVPAEGGSDAETAENMRETAPRAIRTLGRAVARSDFAAFAEGYRGVGQAAVDELRVGGVRTVVVTVATTSYAPPAAGSPLLADLRSAIVGASPPGTKVLVTGFVELPMSVTVAFAHDPALRRSEVEDRIRAALVARFGPDVRPFARAVHRSEVVATVQDVRGVVTVRLVDFTAPGVVEDAQGRLPCPGPQAVGTTVQLARRLSLPAAGITFQELTP